MRSLWFFLCLLVACNRDSIQQAELVPGESIGPVRIGATRAELSTLGLTVRGDPSGQGGDQAGFAGPFSVILDATEHVESIAVDLTKLPKGLRFGAATLHPETSYEAAVVAFTPCEPARPYVGGTATSCQGGKLLIERSTLPRAPLRVRVLRPSAL